MQKERQKEKKKKERETEQLQMRVLRIVNSCVMRNLPVESIASSSLAAGIGEDVMRLLYESQKSFIDELRRVAETLHKDRETADLVVQNYFNPELKSDEPQDLF